MKNIESTRKGLSSLQIKKETLEKIKSTGKKNENYDQILNRIIDNQVEIDKGLKNELEKLSTTTGIEKKTLIAFGLTIVIFLASSGALQELQKMAITQKKPLAILFLELIKKFFKI